MSRTCFEDYMGTEHGIQIIVIHFPHDCWNIFVIADEPQSDCWNEFVFADVAAGRPQLAFQQRSAVATLWGIGNCKDIKRGSRKKGEQEEVQRLGATPIVFLYKGPRARSLIVGSGLP